MRIKSSSMDMGFTMDGDLVVNDEVGDFEQVGTSSHALTRQQIYMRLSSSPGEWLNHRMTGIDMKRYVGLPNSASTGAMIQAAIVAELTRDNLIDSNNIEVKVFPANKHALGILISAKIPTVSHKDFVMMFSWDIRDNSLIPRGG